MNKKILIGLLTTIIFILLIIIGVILNKNNQKITNDINEKAIDDAINTVNQQSNNILGEKEQKELKEMVAGMLKTEQNLKKIYEPYIRVETQNIGNKIKVSYADWDKDSFVVIKRLSDRSNNFQDEIMGVSKILSPGKNENFEISLKTGVSGEVLFAWLYEDNGDRIFNESSDANVADPRNGVLKIRQRFDVRTK